MDVLVARIGKPHGIKGEVTVQLFTDAPEDRFDAGATFRVEGAALNELTVVQARWNKDILIVGFEQIADRNHAETLRGAQLFIDTAGEQDDDDAWYEHELVGLVALVDSVAVGTVTALRTMAVQDLLVVELTGGHEVYVPFVGEIVPEVSPGEGFIVMTPPTGLFELNTPGSNQASADAAAPITPRSPDAEPDPSGSAGPGTADPTAAGPATTVPAADPGSAGQAAGGTRP